MFLFRKVGSATPRWIHKLFYDLKKYSSFPVIPLNFRVVNHQWSQSPSSLPNPRKKEAVNPTPLFLARPKQIEELEAWQKWCTYMLITSIPFRKSAWGCYRSSGLENKKYIAIYSQMLFKVIESWTSKVFASSIIFQSVGIINHVLICLPSNSLDWHHWIHDYDFETHRFVDPPWHNHQSNLFIDK